MVRGINRRRHLAELLQKLFLGVCAFCVLPKVLNFPLVTSGSSPCDSSRVAYAGEGMVFLIEWPRSPDDFALVVSKRVRPPNPASFMQGPPVEVMDVHRQESFMRRLL